MVDQREGRSTKLIWASISIWEGWRRKPIQWLWHWKATKMGKTRWWKITCSCPSMTILSVSLMKISIQGPIQIWIFQSHSVQVETQEPIPKRAILLYLPDSTNLVPKTNWIFHSRNKVVAKVLAEESYLRAILDRQMMLQVTITVRAKIKIE